jgi:hypothetical protein
MTWCSTSGRWQDEIDVAEQLVGFFQQFLEIFTELKGKKFYVTGESVSQCVIGYRIRFDIKTVCGNVHSVYGSILDLGACADDE